jgi:hypothetical protein
MTDIVLSTLSTLSKTAVRARVFRLFVFECKPTSNLFWCDRFVKWMNYSAFAVFAVIIVYFLYYAVTRRNQCLCLECGYRFNRDELNLVCPFCGSDDIAPAPFASSNRDYIRPPI